MSADEIPPARRVVSVNLGTARPLATGNGTVMSGIDKRAAAGAVNVHLLGLEGDEQADLTVHGGPSKAVYAYPSEHLAFWRTVRAQAGVAGWEEPLRPGALGENLTLAGLLESQVCIGDVLRFPNCVLAVSEPRMPCFKLNAALGFAHAAKLMAKSGWCGFYLSVRTPGTIVAGEAYELLPGPRDIGIAELFRARIGRAKLD